MSESLLAWFGSAFVEPRAELRPEAERLLNSIRLADLQGLNGSRLATLHELFLRAARCARLAGDSVLEGELLRHAARTGRLSPDVDYRLVHHLMRNGIDDIDSLRRAMSVLRRQPEDSELRQWCVSRLMKLKERDSQGGLALEKFANLMGLRFD